jgi:hypothetical protein
VKSSGPKLKILRQGCIAYAGEATLRLTPKRSSRWDERGDRLWHLLSLTKLALPAGITAGFSGETVLEWLRALEELAEMAAFWDETFTGDVQDEGEASRHLDDLFERVTAAFGPLEDIATASAALARGQEPIAQSNGQEPIALDSARHSPDFRSVHWFGTDYTFTANQAACVKTLWQAWKNGTPGVGKETLLSDADARTERVDHIFRDNPAWKTMICASAKGVYRLCPPQ